VNEARGKAMNFHPLPEDTTVIQKNEVSALPNTQRLLRNIEDTILKVADSLFVGFSHSLTEVMIFNAEGHSVSIYGSQVPLVTSLIFIASSIISGKENCKTHNCRIHSSEFTQAMPCHDRWSLSYTVDIDFDKKTVQVFDLEDPQHIFIPYQHGSAIASAILMCLTASQTKNPLNREL
jgi:hypothetical protein